MAKRRLKAKCLCGDVRIDADTAEHVTLSVCHCDTCRRWCGGPFMAIETVEEVVIAGTDALGIYESSDWGERGFCKNCGSALFFRMKDGSMVGLSAMACEGIDEAEIAEQIFVDSKPKWYDLANETKMLTGIEVLQHLAANQEPSDG